jgi:RimJ/RimL family protein N-acetyltransferase
MNIINDDLILRAIEPEDNEILRNMLNDPDIENMTTGWGYPVSTSQQLEWYKKQLELCNTDLRCVISINEIGAVGMIRLSDIDWKNRNAVIHIKLLLTHRNKGYGTHAINTMVNYSFEQLGLKVIYAYISDKNENSKKSFLKCGFEIEGLLRKRIFKNGAFCDVIITSIINHN